MKGLTIVDAHAHIFPGKIAQRAGASIGEFYDLDMHTCGFPHRLKESGDKVGVKKYLVCTAATRPEQVASINDFIARKCTEYPEFFGFGTLHPEMEDVEGEIRRIVELGLHGIKLHPDFQEFMIDAQSVFPLYQTASDAGLPILFHTGDIRYEYSCPRRLAVVAEKFSRLTCIASHFGGYQRWEEARETLAGRENVYYDTSSSLFVLEKEEALRLMDAFTPEKMMFGTDFPMWTHEDELKRFLSLELSVDSRDQILYRTFQKLFGVSVEGSTCSVCESTGA